MDTVTVNGMVLSAMPIGEYDRRIVLLTTDLGRISAFVRGARRPNSSLLAAARPFSMGIFTLHAGRDSYTVQTASIKEYFEAVSSDVTKMAYGCYFLEAAGFASEENDDGRELLNLFLVMGVYPQVFECSVCKSKLTKGWLSVERGNCVCEECAKRKNEAHTSARLYLDESAMYTLQYILTAPIGRLYTFCLEEPVKRTLYDLTVKWRRRYFSREFKSLQVLEEMVHFMGTL